MAFTLSFIIYTLFIVGIGLYAARFGRSSDADYFLAGRTLGPWVAAMSASASSMSGWVTLGLVGLAFSNGFSAYWLLPGCVIGFAFNWFVIAGPLRDRAEGFGALTIPDFLAFHFRERRPILRLISVVVIFIAMLTYIAAQFASAGKAFEASFDGFDYRLGVIVGAAIVVVYTVIGGFRAACWTDFAQAIVMVAALVIFPIVMLAELGGFEFVQTQLAKASTPENDLLSFTPDKSAIGLVGFLLGSGAMGINLGYPGQPHILVRFMGMARSRDVWLGGTVGTVWSILLLWGAITIGLIIRAIALDGAEWAGPVNDDGEIALVLGAKNLLHGVFGGLVLAAILAALASTADSQLVVAASAAANDVYARLFDRGRSGSHPWINRGVVMVLGILATLFVLFDKAEVYTLVVKYGWAMLGAAFGPQLILILLWRRASYAGCVAGMLVGFVLAIIWPQIWTDEVVKNTGVELYNLTVGFFAAFIVNVVVSLLLPSPAPVLTGREDITES